MDCWSVVTENDCSFSSLLSNTSSFSFKIFTSKKLSLKHEFRRPNWRKYSARLFSSWKRATKAMPSANFTRVSKALVDTTSLVYTDKTIWPKPSSCHGWGLSGLTCHGWGTVWAYLSWVGNCLGLLVMGGELSTCPFYCGIRVTKKTNITFYAFITNNKVHLYCTGCVRKIEVSGRACRSER